MTTTAEPATFGARIVAARTALRIPQEEVEEHAGMSTGHLSKIERGKVGATLGIAEKIVSYFARRQSHVYPWLLSGHGERPTAREIAAARGDVLSTEAKAAVVARSAQDQEEGPSPGRR